MDHGWDRSNQTGSREEKSNDATLSGALPCRALAAVASGLDTSTECLRLQWMNETSQML
jgi:hypothetical protein